MCAWLTPIGGDDGTTCGNGARSGDRCASPPKRLQTASLRIREQNSSKLVLEDGGVGDRRRDVCVTVLTCPHSGPVQAWGDSYFRPGTPAGTSPYLTAF